MNKVNNSAKIDKYLSRLPEPQFSTLCKMRKLILELLPGCEECISYGIPAFKLDGKVVGGFAAAKKHCSYYPFSGSTLSTLNKKLQKFEQTKSALHFAHDKPLNKAILKVLLQTRIKEIKKKQ